MWLIGVVTYPFFHFSGIRSENCYVYLSISRVSTFRVSSCSSSKVRTARGNDNVPIDPHLVPKAEMNVAVLCRPSRSNPATRFHRNEVLTLQFEPFAESSASFRNVEKWTRNLHRQRP